MVDGLSSAQAVEEVVAPEVVTTTTGVPVVPSEVVATPSEVAATTIEEAAATAEMVVEAPAAAATTEMVATTTGVVVERTEAAAKASGQDGGGSVHRAGKEIATGISSGTQRDSAITEPEDEEYFNFCADFFGPASIVGSSAFRSRDRVPHPNDIPNRGDTFDNERLEKIWWDKVERVDKLKYPELVYSIFARSTMDVSIRVYLYMWSFLASHCLSFCRKL